MNRFSTIILILTILIIVLVIVGLTTEPSEAPTLLETAAAGLY